MDKDNEISLYGLDWNRQHEIIDLINNDDVLKNTFSGDRNTVSRLINACYVALIKKGNEDIGFVMIVTNPRNNINEIDMGILKDYRGKGYGTKALNLLKQLILDNQLEVEIQISKTNDGAIRSVLNNDFVLSRDDDNFYYYTLLDDIRHER